MAPVSCIFFFFFFPPRKTYFFILACVCECAHVRGGFIFFSFLQMGEIPERRHSGTGSLVGGFR